MTLQKRLVESIETSPLSSALSLSVYGSRDCLGWQDRAGGSGKRPRLQDRIVSVCGQRARKGEIKDFTGISSPYETPENADLIVQTGDRSVTDCVADVIGHLESRNLIAKS